VFSVLLRLSMWLRSDLRCFLERQRYVGCLLNERSALHLLESLVMLFAVERLRNLLVHKLVLLPLQVFFLVVFKLERRLHTRIYFFDRALPSEFGYLRQFDFVVGKTKEVDVFVDFGQLGISVESLSVLEQLKSHFVNMSRDWLGVLD